MQFYVDFGTAINHGFYLDLDELCGFEVLRDNLNLPDLGLTEEFSKNPTYYCSSAIGLGGSEKTAV